MTPRRLCAPAVWLTLAAGAMTSSPSAQSAGAGVTGRVIDAGTNQPVRRAIVTLSGAALPNGRSSVTDDDGRFAFARVPDGDFALSATRPGFLRATYGATRPGRPGTPLAVRAGTPPAEITLQMTHGSALDGVLRDAAGDVAPGYRVQAILLRHTAAGDQGEEAGVAKTDDRGEFRIYGLAAGDYVLAATPNIITGGMGDIGAPTEAEVDAKLAALRSRANAPAPTAPASAPATPAPSKGYGTPATYFPGVVQSGEAVPITLGPNEAREGLDFALRLTHAAAIDGTIVPARGMTLPVVQLDIQGDGPQLPVFGGSMARGPSVSQRASDHTFRITNVPPGHYRISAKTFGASGAAPQIMSSGGALPAAAQSGAPQWASLDIDMTGEDISGVTLVLQPVPAVSGRLVLDATATKPPADLSSARVALEPVPASDRRSNGLTSPLIATVHPDGTLDWPSVIPGVYHLTARLSGWWPRAATAGADDVLDGDLTVGANGVTGLTITLSDRHSGIGGTLIGAGDRPAPAYYLVAFTTDRAMWRAPSRRVRSTRPATSGAYDISDLPPGQYYLAALTDLDAADLDDAAFLESLIPAAVTVNVAEGQRAIQDLRIGG